MTTYTRGGYTVNSEVIAALAICIVYDALEHLKVIEYGRIGDYITDCYCCLRTKDVIGCDLKLCLKQANNEE